MNVTEYTSLINQSNAINNKQTLALERVVAEFPFFQSARAIKLKGLYNENSFRYNYDLKTTAAYTSDRSILFDYITSDDFIAIHKNLHQEKMDAIHNIFVSESEIVQVSENTIENESKQKAPLIETKLEQSILTSIQTAMPVSEIVLEPKEKAQPIEEKLEIGKPLEFTNNEKHSFNEWLQLSKFEPILREETSSSVESNPDINIEKLKKNELIDKFIETSPRIPQIKQDTPQKLIFEPKEDQSYLMTETLAKVYLEQKKYQKAIQAYEILILKYPEKISFFADRISDIKYLQQNNN
ncbi:MAG: tetratricopeptide repeat protein [Bacteroidota bacterium]